MSVQVSAKIAICQFFSVRTGRQTDILTLHCLGNRLGHHVFFSVIKGGSKSVTPPSTGCMTCSAGYQDPYSQWSLLRMSAYASVKGIIYNIDL